MDKEWMFEAFGDIDETYVQEATRKPVNWKFILKIAAATAAVVVLIIGLVILIDFDQRGYLFDKSSNDGWKLIMPNYYEKEPNSGISSGVEHVPYIEFKSLDEMRNDILTGNFTEQELQEFARRLEYGYDIKCPDLDNLYVPVCPDGITMAGPVKWYFGSSYDLSLNYDRSKYHINMDICSNHLLSIRLADYQEFQNGKDGINPVTILESKYDPERNAMEYYYLTHTDKEHKAVFYFIEQGDKLIFVRETFRNFGDTVPYVTDVAMQDGDGCAWFTLSDYAERLTPEFIASFGLEKYN